MKIKILVPIRINPVTTVNPGKIFEARRLPVPASFISVIGDPGYQIIEDGPYIGTRVKVDECIEVEEVQRPEAPARVFIPRMLATEIEWRRDQGQNNYTILDSILRGYTSEKLRQWVSSDGSQYRGDIIMTALINGYRVDDEGL